MKLRDEIRFEKGPHRRVNNERDVASIKRERPLLSLLDGSRNPIKAIKLWIEARKTVEGKFEILLVESQNEVNEAVADVFEIQFDTEIVGLLFVSKVLGYRVASRFLTGEVKWLRR